MKCSYKFRITFRKFWIVFAEVLIAGLISYLTDCEYFLIIIPMLEAARNYLKHNKLYEEVKGG